MGEIPARVGAVGWTRGYVLRNPVTGAKRLDRAAYGIDPPLYAEASEVPDDHGHGSLVKIRVTQYGTPPIVIYPLEVLEVLGEELYHRPPIDMTPVKLTPDTAHKIYDVERLPEMRRAAVEACRNEDWGAMSAYTDAAARLAGNDHENGRDVEWLRARRKAQS